MINLSQPVILKWKSFKSEAKLPTKRDSDVGYDIYTIENNVTLKPHETRLFSTGLGCLMPQNIWLRAVDRGSTGSKGIHTYCGIIDEQYMGEIFIALHNGNDFPILFTDEVKKVEYDHWLTSGDIIYDKYMKYPISKGICQLIPELRLDSSSEFVTDDEWEQAVKKSERGDTKLGQSGK